MSPSPSCAWCVPQRYAALVMPFVLSILMSLVVSSVSTLRSIGVNPTFFSIWPMAWLLSWLVAFPTLLMILPLVRRIVSLVVEPAPR